MTTSYAFAVKLGHGISDVAITMTKLRFWVLYFIHALPESPGASFRSE